MIYAYSTLLNEKARLQERLKELKRVEDSEEVHLVIQEIKWYIQGINESLEILEDHVFVS